MPLTEAHSLSNYSEMMRGSWKHLAFVEDGSFSEEKGITVEKSGVWGGWGRCKTLVERRQEENNGTRSHLGFSLLCTKRTFFSFTSFQLKWPALSSCTSFPFLESTSCPLVGVLTTWNRRSSTLPSWSWTFRREKSSSFIKPMARVREPFTWRPGVCVLPGKHGPKDQAW